VAGDCGGGGSSTAFPNVLAAPTAPALTAAPDAGATASRAVASAPTTAPVISLVVTLLVDIPSPRISRDTYEWPQNYSSEWGFKAISVACFSEARPWGAATRRRY
jgi:hypothetical protein